MESCGSNKKRKIDLEYIREKYPRFNDLSDDEVLEKIYFYYTIAEIGFRSYMNNQIILNE
ncbi:hypothetical protein KC678_01545 [Candidatus Dojkabacteria bacterium]|uniref:Uncharacterized protein n=1 Tax=Candidatus Dojkabacteria bacterium TaxID=2099670 RepID=A0A955L1J2_9BACT|nr:hypothetical protein [Candidatus Dojkabacteria bacterium]